MGRHSFAFVLIATAIVMVLPGGASAQLEVSQIPRLVSYQGYLESEGTPFDGVADFKFAITCLEGLETRWSNDGSSTTGDEPASAVAVPVDQGAFSVALGDTALGMLPVVAEYVLNCLEAELRVWVDTGSGFEALPAQAISSSVYAHNADAANRALLGFYVEGGALVVGKSPSEEVIQLIPGGIGPISGPTVQMFNDAGLRTVSIVADSAEVGTPALRLYDAAGVETIGLDGGTGEARVSSLRFGDGTVQSTAGGGGGADSDWVVLGNNMHSGVSGNVGIGTNASSSHLTISRVFQEPAHQLELRNEGSITSSSFDGIKFTQDTLGSTLLAEMKLQYRNNGRPDLRFNLRDHSAVLFMEGSSGYVGVGNADPSAQLEVSGTATRLLYVRREQTTGADASIAIRGSRNSTTTTNVASIEFRNYDSDEGAGTDYLMARIGAGMATTTGGTGDLRFFTNGGGGEGERVRIDRHGNVGIGTDTPTEKLDVDGNAHFSGTVTVAPTTRYLAVPAAAFGPLSSLTSFSRTSTNLIGTNSGQAVDFRAALILPHGVTIKEVRFVLSDAAAGNMTARLKRYDQFSNFSEILAEVTTSGTPGYGVQFPVALDHTVNHQNYVYALEAEWVTPNVVSQLQVRSVRVLYEVTNLAP